VKSKQRSLIAGSSRRFFAPIHHASKGATSGIGWRSHFDHYSLVEKGELPRHHLHATEAWLARQCGTSDRIRSATEQVGNYFFSNLAEFAPTMKSNARRPGKIPTFTDLLRSDSREWW
jgi:hypothetical protein